MPLNDIQLDSQMLTHLYGRVLIEPEASTTAPLPDLATSEPPASAPPVPSATAPQPQSTQPAPQPSASPQPAAAPLRYLGQNEKRVLVVVTNEEVPYLPDDELAFLTSVLSACGLGLADIALVNRATTPLGYEELLVHLGSQTVLLFDVAPLDFGLPIQFPHYQVQHFNNRNYLAAPRLARIEPDKAAKRQLWGALKALFSI